MTTVGNGQTAEPLSDQTRSGPARRGRRLAAVATANDFNADMVSDVLWRNVSGEVDTEPKDHRHMPRHGGTPFRSAAAYRPTGRNSSR